MSGARRVLLLEPDPDLRAVLRALCADAAFEVVVCSSLLEVLARAESVRGEVAVVDVCCAGDPLLERRARVGLRCVGGLLPLVVLTDRAWASAGEPGDIGALAVLLKPVSLESLLGELHEASRARIVQGICSR